MAKRKLTRQQSRRIAKQQDVLMQGLDKHALEAGLVISRYGKQADVETSDGAVFRCHLRRNLGDLVTGDRVALQREGEGAVIVSVETARNRLQRPDSYGKLKAVAANIDQMLIVIAAQPEPHGNLIDRYLVVAENLAIEPVLLLNKSDLLTSESRRRIDSLTSLYQGLNYSMLEVSAKTGLGQEALEAQLCERTSIVVGQSGVGKSSLLQHLLPDEAIKIGELSEQVAKGTHTTTYSRLYHFPSGGQCIDSPGIREFGLWHFSRQQVTKGFIELQHHAAHCKFSDCSHQHEPGCAVLIALESGAINPLRYDSFLRIIETLDNVQVKN